MATPTFENRMVSLRARLGISRDVLAKLLFLTVTDIESLERGDGIPNDSLGKVLGLAFQISEQASISVQPRQLLHDAADGANTTLKRGLFAVSPKSRPTKRGAGAREAVSRYVRLKADLDGDLFNNRWVAVDTAHVNKKHGFRYLDLFSGAGGKSQGFSQAGFKKVFSVEIDEDASATIRRNFPESEHFEGPIENVTNEHLLKIAKKEVQVVCGGPPCQGFSVAGWRREDDARNTLFLEFVRVVKAVKPDFVVLENVPGILTLADGKFYRWILDEFAAAGYPGMSVRILEAAEYGVPQLRTRAIFVGNRHGLTNPFPKETHNKSNYVSMRSAIQDLEDAPSNPAINHEWTAHSKEMEERLALIPPGGSLYPSYRDAWKRQFADVPCMAIKENHGAPHVHYKLNRTISAREMARLQTFPDSFIFTGRMKRAMWQIGNAVPSLLAEKVALALVPSLETLRTAHKKRELVTAGR